MFPTTAWASYLARRRRRWRLSLGALRRTAELRDLHREYPDTRLLVMANRPSSDECRQILAFGATACLAKRTEARDLLHAIHLASRGLHVLPSAVVSEHEAVGPELLTPREAEGYRKLGVKTRRELRARVWSAPSPTSARPSAQRRRTR